MSVSRANENGILAMHVATVSPTANDDANDGYSVGTRWINTITQAEFVCIDNTVGAAVWRHLTISPASKVYTSQSYR